MHKTRTARMGDKHYCGYVSLSIIEIEREPSRVKFFCGKAIKSPERSRLVNHKNLNKMPFNVIFRPSTNLSMSNNFVTLSSSF